jgi:hypothetical protein
MKPQDDIDLLSEEELRDAAYATVASSGYSLEELRTHAQTGTFPTERARRTWGAVKHILDHP